MECVHVQNVVSVLLDGAEPQEERKRLAQHATQCVNCARALNDQRRVRVAMLHMRREQPSEHLQTTLRVLASRERQRRVARLNLSNQLAEWREHARLTLKNLMQPFALPIAGGLASALLLFAILLPDFPMVATPIIDDVPTVLFTEPSVKDAVVVTLASEVVVDLTVDEAGRMVDYSIVSGAPLLRDEAVRRRFESALIFTQFTPATAFGQPTSGKIRVSFRNSTIDVRG